MADAIVRQESSNLTFLRELAFARPNAETGASAVADALADGDTVGLSRAVEPFVGISQRRGVRLDRLVLFDNQGQAVLHRERDPLSSASWIDLPSHDMSGLCFVQRILAGASDTRRDKYAGLLDAGDGVRYLFTAVPIKQGERIVSGTIVAARLSGMLADLAAQSQSAIITVYDPATDRAFASSIEPVMGLSALDSHPNLVERLVSAPEHGIFDTVAVNERQYQQAFAPLVVRGDIVGVLSVALASDYVIGPWSDMRSSLVGLTIVLMAAIVDLRVFIARQITRPVEELLSVAQDVTGAVANRKCANFGSFCYRWSTAAEATQSRAIRSASARWHNMRTERRLRYQHRELVRKHDRRRNATGAKRSIGKYGQWYPRLGFGFDR